MFFPSFYAFGDILHGFLFAKKACRKCLLGLKNVFLKFFVGLHENQYDIRSGYSSDRSIFLVIVN